MNRINKDPRYSRDVARLRHRAYEKLDGVIARAQAKPALTPVDSYIKQAKIAGLQGFQRFQFLCPESLGYTTALTLDAAIIAGRSARGAALLPISTPVFWACVTLFALVGTGMKTSWEEPNMHPLLGVAALVTRLGLLGLVEFPARKAGRALERSGYDTLATAAYLAASCVSYAVEPLRAALMCLSFVAQIPFACIGALINIAVMSMRVAIQNAAASFAPSAPNVPLKTSKPAEPGAPPDAIPVF